MIDGLANIGDAFHLDHYFLLRQVLYAKTIIGLFPASHHCRRAFTA